MLFVHPAHRGPTSQGTPRAARMPAERSAQNPERSDGPGSAHREPRTTAPASQPAPAADDRAGRALARQAPRRIGRFPRVTIRHGGRAVCLPLVMEGWKEVTGDVDVRFASHPRWLQLARTVVEECCSGFEIAPSSVRDLVIAVGEAVSNVMRHGYGGDRTRPVRVLCRCDGGAVEVEVWDRGCRFDPIAHPVPPLDRRSRGGRGLYLIRSTVDEVKYTREEGWNRLRLRKRLPIAAVAGERGLRVP